jgi:hypothetical protein
MADFERFEFVLPGYTPETMPGDVPMRVEFG